ncbi:uncharacterized protein LOC143275976 [Babylonia areolata]|uniref:uncharacterized protein LOC143275976 n=1 Tax=Babylonia areolata TaxID=304850 RepID=UPI003FD028C9
MLAATIPVLGHSTATMGISQPEDDFDLSPGRSPQGVYLALTVSASTSPNDSERSDDIFLETSRSPSPLLASSPESSKEVVGQDAPVVKYTDDQEKSVETEKQASCVKPKYGSTIVGLPDKFMKKVETLGKEKETRKKKKWRAVNAEDMGFKLTLFPREPVTCDEKKVESESKSFYAMIEAELDHEKDQLKPFRHLLQLEGTGLNRETKFTRKDSDRRVQKAHKQVKSKDITSVLNNRGRKTLYIHFRIYKQHPFLHCSNLEHPNLPSPPRREGVCLEVAKSAIRAQTLNPEFGIRAPRHPVPAQNLHHALDNRNAANDLPTDLVSFLISLQHREMTPEDYEMLLRLDEGVAPKTVAEDVISALKTDVVDESSAGEVCSVCMEMYEVGQCRKFLPCDHVFHEQCIDMWLANSSQNCPLDGLPVGFS